MIRKRVQIFLENNKWLKKVPTTLTICNSLCGFAAILMSLHVYSNDKSDPARVLEICAWTVLFAMVFDVLDGFTARIFHATSLHGLQMDSLSDMVTFGVAPAVIVAVMAHRFRDLSSFDYYIVWSLCAFYLACAANRLANYNVHAMLEKKRSDKFSGLPSPGAAAGLCSLVIYYSISEKELRQIVFVLPAYAALLGLLMVSNVRYAHIGKWLQSVKRNKRRLFLLLVFSGVFAFKPVITLLIAINAYILFGVLAWMINPSQADDSEKDMESSESESEAAPSKA